MFLIGAFYQFIMFLFEMLPFNTSSILYSPTPSPARTGPGSTFYVKCWRGPRVGEFIFTVPPTPEAPVRGRFLKPGVYNLRFGTIR